MIAQAPNGSFPVDSTLNIPDLEVVGLIGTLKGVMQVGSSVAGGESQALWEAARRTSSIIKGSVNNKAAITRQTRQSTDCKRKFLKQVFGCKNIGNFKMKSNHVLNKVCVPRGVST